MKKKIAIILIITTMFCNVVSFAAVAPSTPAKAVAIQKAAVVKKSSTTEAASAKTKAKAAKLAKAKAQELKYEAEKKAYRLKYEAEEKAANEVVKAELAYDESIIVFENKEVEAAVRDSLKNYSLESYTGLVTGKQVKVVGDLELKNLQDKNLSDLPKLHGLNNLHISDSGFTEIPDLSKLNIISLWVSGNKISSLPDKPYMKKLITLTCDEKSLVNITALTQYTNLQCLFLENSAITELPFNLPKLTNLSIKNTSISDLHPLLGMEDTLTTLYMSNTLVHDITPLRGFDKLDGLDIDNTKVTEMEIIISFTEKGKFVNAVGCDLPFNTIDALKEKYPKSAEELSRIKKLGEDAILRRADKAKSEAKKAEYKAKQAEYNVKQAENDVKQAAIEAEKANALSKVKEIIAKIIRPEMSALEKERTIHDWLVLNTTYDYANYLAGTIPSQSYQAAGPLLYQKGVCSGYANAFQMFMDELGIQSKYVSGIAFNSISPKGGGHAWNEVTIDGLTYMVDTTWDDPVGTDDPNYIRHKYFNIPLEKAYGEGVRVKDADN